MQSDNFINNKYISVDKILRKKRICAHFCAYNCKFVAQSLFCDIV